MNLFKVIEICKDFVPQCSYWSHWHCLWKGKGSGMDGSLVYTVSCSGRYLFYLCVLPVRRIPVREGTTVPFWRMLLSVLQMDMIAKDVDDFGQDVGMLQH